eukprot:TRINITY_DN9146_c0_g2_i1.p1 TRINITY_DN9146_c0_g2~~TRINITY_DN9146_c0_g2_i1.p1  ORF type:complete len:451 (-),score=43.68 TRINITY_DN9146_c0_g2_i1:111-1337(-)
MAAEGTSSGKRDVADDVDQSTAHADCQHLEQITKSTNERDSDKLADPDRLLCPITHVMFRDPVFVPDSGNTYEKEAIMRYWASQGQTRDPLTNTPLTAANLHTNWGVRRDVQRFLDAHPGHIPQGWPNREVPMPPKTKVARVRLRPCILVVVTLLVTLIVFAICCLAYFADDDEPAAGFAESTAGNAVATASPSSRFPQHSRLDARYHGSRLEVRVPPAGLGQQAFGQVLFSVVWLSVTAVWTIGMLQGKAPFFVLCFSLVFWGSGASMLVDVGRMLFVSEVMTVDVESYSIFSRVFGRDVEEVHGLLADLNALPEVKCVGDQRRHSHDCQLVFEDSYLEVSYALPEVPRLRRAEAKWFKETVEEHLQHVASACFTKLHKQNDEGEKRSPQRQPHMYELVNGLGFPKR